MNRFPLWKYVLIGITLVIAFLYTLPNFFGEVPAVQISPIRTTEKVDTALLGQVESSLKAANLGDDADTTAAVCGQIAGAYYGVSDIPEHWQSRLVMGQEIQDLADKLLDLSRDGPGK